MGLATRMAIYNLMEKRKEGRTMNQNQGAKMVGEQENKPLRLHHAIMGVRGIVYKLESLHEDITLHHHPEENCEKEMEPEISLQYICNNATGNMLERAKEIITITAEIGSIVMGSGSLGGQIKKVMSGAADTHAPKDSVSIPEDMYNAFTSVRTALSVIGTLKEEIEEKSPTVGEQGLTGQAPSGATPPPTVQYVLDELPNELDKEVALAESRISDIRRILGV